ncbi:FMN-dependent NADPH-azoreductase-like [Amphiura filiformis]|uniref:FMN-dependent NADPH-azoreductase-like n=1 Tax=Amphiura filiformis TaxID=82378 RepID=UPI003B21FFBB
MAKPLKVVLFLGTCREGRLGLRVANFMINELKKTGHEVEFFDAASKPFNQFPILEKAMFFYKEGEKVPEWMAEAKQKVVDADAYLMVSGEYNHSIPPGLTNMIDHFPTSIFGYKPSGIVCYSPGIYGGMRAAIQLRAFLGEMGCLPVSNIFGIPKVHQAIDGDGKPLDSHMESGAKKLIDQLDWHAHAMRNHREKVGTPK